jgi:hypothetical protein
MCCGTEAVVIFAPQKQGDSSPLIKFKSGRNLTDETQRFPESPAFGTIRR